MSNRGHPFSIAEAEIVPMRQSQSITPTTYRIAPDLRRCCWYGIVAAILMIPVALWISSVVEYAPPKQKPEPVPVAIMLLSLRACGSNAVTVPAPC